MDKTFRAPSLALILLACIYPVFCPAADKDQAAVEEVPAAGLSYPLPRSILNRMKIAGLEAPEFRKDMETIMGGADISDAAGSSHTNVFRAADGTVFCCDHWSMSLWVRRKQSWECLLQGNRVEKTFGGAPPRLEVRYLGKGFFAFSRTLPGNRKELPGDKFPMAKAATFLLDSKTGEIVARGESYRYDHNPPVNVPSGWYARIGITPPEDKP